MTVAEKLLEESAKKNMVQWNQESFKRTHPKLHKTIIEAINNALLVSTPPKCKCIKCGDEEPNPICSFCQQF